MLAINRSGDFDSLVASLAEDERRIHRMQQQVAELEEDLEDRTFIGTDRSRVVTVTLRRDGKICDLQITEDWRRSTTPTRLASNVTAAFESARSNLRKEVSRVYGRAGFTQVASGLETDEEADDGIS